MAKQGNISGSRTAGGIVITEEETMLLSTAAEWAQRAVGEIIVSPFLTPRQQRLLYEDAQRCRRTGQLFFWGGYPGATRRMAFFLPEWLSGLADTPFHEEKGALFSAAREAYFCDLLSLAGEELRAEPDGAPFSRFFVSLRLQGSGFRQLSHRDWLGSLMSLGIKREILGDIVTESSAEAILFCETKSRAYLEEELTRAGRDAVRASVCTLPPDFAPTLQFEEIRSTVASPRVDGVVRALCNTSREDAAAMIRHGLVEVNYFPTEEPDSIVEAGDVLSVRGYGKYYIDRVQDPTRRDRLRLEARKVL